MIYPSSLRIYVSALLLTTLTSFPAFAEVPLAEMLRSRAGRYIFSELTEGSSAASRLLGDGTPGADRMAELLQRLSDPSMRDASKQLSERLNRVYDAYSRENPERARLLFSESGTGRKIVLGAAERELLHDLASREFDRVFIESLPTPAGYANSRARFARGDRTSLEAPISARGRALIYWETQANGAGVRSAAPVQLENYEIPIDLLEVDVAKRMPKDLAETLIFEKKGRKFVRWIINPEDTKHYKEVEKFLTGKGIEPVRHKTFTAFQTSSRSYIISDVKNGRRLEFSAKVSTDVTGGNWRDKKQPVEDAAEARRAADFVNDQAKSLGLKNIVIMDEPAMFGIREIDQAMLVRALADLKEGEFTYLPGFSALHEDLGRKIARANGSLNPAEFWNEHYNKPLGRALAEFAAKTGLTYDSPHSQNFLVEMVGIKPTGRIVLRDFGDTYAVADFFEAMKKDEFLKQWAKDNIIHGRLHAGIGVLHGNKFPSWIDQATYDQWGKDFYQAFDAELSAETGVPLEELQGKVTRSGNYFSKDFAVRGQAWDAFFERLGSKD